MALVRVPKELKSLCIEHNREPREHSANEDFAQGVSRRVINPLWVVTSRG